MARSIRSKRGMALRKVKRERYGAKERIRLNKMLGIPNKEDKCEEDVDMASDDDEKRGLSSKDYKLLKNIVKDGSDSEESDVGKEFEEVMVMTSSKFLRKKCQAMVHTENKRQDAEDEADAKGETALGELSVHEVKKLNQRISAKLVDDFGSYPKWMNQRKIKALAKVNRSLKKKKNKRLGQAAKKRVQKPKASLVSDDDSEREEDEASEENAAEDSSMETDDVAAKTTEEMPKGQGKAKNAKRGKKGKIETTTEDSVNSSEEATQTQRKRARGKKGNNKKTTNNAVNSSSTQEDVETIDLSD